MVHNATKVKENSETLGSTTLKTAVCFLVIAVDKALITDDSPQHGVSVTWACCQRSDLDAALTP